MIPLLSVVVVIIGYAYSDRIYSAYSLVFMSGHFSRMFIALRRHEV